MFTCRNVDPITARTLNRTTLQRQLLLERAPLDALSAVHQLVGLQAQVPTNPYPGLWSRLEGFDATDLGTLLVEREVVRIASIRGTIHLLTADDCLGFWPLFRPVFDRELAAHPEVGPALAGIDLDPVLEWARALLGDEPLSLPAFRAALAERFPAHDPAALAYACRNHLALVQVPPRGLLGRSHQVTVTTAEAWLGRPLAASPSVDDLVLRYLRAFGPATAADIATWSRLTGIAAVLDRLGASSGNGRMTQGEPCGMPRTASWPTRGYRRRCGSCPSTTTCSSPMPTAPASSARSPPPPSTPAANSGAGTCSSTAPFGDRGGSQTASWACCIFRSPRRSGCDGRRGDPPRRVPASDDPPAVTVTAV